MNKLQLIPIACNSWFANKSTTQHTFSSKIKKNYIKHKVNIVIYPTNFIPNNAAIYSEQFIYSDNSQNKIELYRLDQRNLEARNLTGGLNGANLTTVNFSRFNLHRIYSEKINKTDSKLTRLIFSFFSSHELVLKFYIKKHKT